MDLKKARKSGKVKEFIKEHEKDPKGDKDKLDKAITSLARRTSKSTRGTSRRGSSER